MGKVIKSFVFIGILTLFLGSKEKNFASPIESPRGIYCLVPKDAPPKATLINIPYINGFVVRTGWQNIEPKEGELDWSYIDSWIDALKKTNKKLILCIVAGVATPDWVYSAGADEFDFIYKKRFLRMPIPWDGVYLKKWCGFIKDFGKRYNKEDSIICVRMTGAGFAGEMHLPKGKKNIKRWLRVGYTKEKLINAWKAIIDAYKEAFEDKALSIAIANPLRADGAVNEVLAYGMKALGKRFCIQGNWLSGKTSLDFALYKLIKEYSKKTTVGFQVLAPFINRARMGEAKEAIDKGLAASASYFEVYRVDIESRQFKVLLEFINGKLKALERSPQLGKGLFVRLSLKQRDIQVPDYPLLSGAQLQFLWEEIEPTDGKFDFEQIERVINRWAKKKKKVILAIPVGAASVGSACPDWLFKKIRYCIHPKREIKIPVYWDDTYLSYYNRLIKEIAKRYDGDGRIEMIRITLGAYATTRIPLWQVRVLKKEGFTYKLWFETIKKVCRFYKSAFKKIPLMIVISRGFSDATEAGWKEHIEKVAEYAAKSGINIFSHTLSGEGEKLCFSELPFAKVFNKIHKRYPKTKLILGPDNPLSSKEYAKKAGDIKTAARFAIGDCYDSKGRYIPKTYISYAIFYLEDIMKAAKGDKEFDEAFSYIVKNLESKRRHGR